MRLVEAHYGNIIKGSKDTSPGLRTLQFEPSHRLGLFLANWSSTMHFVCSRGLYLVTDDSSASEAIHEVPDGDEAYSRLALLKPDGSRYFTDWVRDWALSSGDGRCPDAIVRSDPCRVSEVIPFNLAD
jgi:hypothetical protein